jgi:hypothetical protein
MSDFNENRDEIIGSDVEDIVEDFELGLEPE